MWVPDWLLSWYSEFAHYLSIAALVLQGIILLDLSSYWNDLWTQDDRRTGEEGYWTFLALFSAGILWVIAFTTCILSYFWFVGEGCGLNVALITATLVSGILYSLLSVTGWFESGSLLCSSMVNAYAVYMCWSAMASEPSECNSWAGDFRSSLTLILTSVAVSSIALCTIGLVRRTNEGNNGLIAERFLVLVDEEGKPPETLQADPQFTAFFAYLACFSVYSGMLLSNWGAATVDPSKTGQSR
jgi:hypothetical protein